MGAAGADFASLVRAVIAAEDQRFCSHRGVDWIELNSVLEDEDGPSRGASTLTMQTAKNVFLWPGRSYLRKALEIPLALAIDLAWPKQRVIEVYLNVAEWGEGLFGAEAAAQRYFSKPAARLTSVGGGATRRRPAQSAAARSVAAEPGPAGGGRAGAAARRATRPARRLRPAAVATDRHADSLIATSERLKSRRSGSIARRARRIPGSARLGVSRTRILKRIQH